MIQIPPNKNDLLNFAAGLGLKLHPWQKSALANIQASNPTAIVCCNGGGKTTNILVPSALWCLYAWNRAKVVVTSSSWIQVEKQIFSEFSRYQSHPLFRSWKFLASEVQSPAGGFIVGISSDNAGRIEGYHAAPDAPLMILADESKSVDDMVFRAFDKCGYTFKAYMSSAGSSQGTFYRCFTDLRDFWIGIVVRSTDCPHISKDLIERDRAMMGQDSDEYRSKHMAEFCAIDGRSVIRPEDIRLAMDAPPPYEDGPEAYFIDWAFTIDGDETVVARWAGNRGEIVLAFRDRPTQSVRRIAAFLRERNITEVYADAGGGGIATNDELWEACEKRVNIRPVHNGSPSSDQDAYAMLNAEVWCEFSRALEKRQLILPNDGELAKQLAGRRRTYDERSRIKLESKASMRARGLSSPDRADALLGSWWSARQLEFSGDYALKVQELVASRRLKHQLGPMLDFGRPFSF